MKRMIFTLGFSVYILCISAQSIAIQEVLYDQPAGLDKFELVNTTGGTINITNYWLCKEFTYYQFGNSAVFEVTEGNLNMPPGSHIKMRMKAPFFLDNTRGDFCVYLPNGCFGCTSDMIDYMQYGTNNPFVGRGTVAVAKGIWSETDEGELDFIPTVTVPGNSTNWNGTNSGGGELTYSSDFTNGAPTLPIGLLTLIGKINMHKQIELDWIAVDEINSRKHVVEKSINGVAFQPIGEVSSKNLGSFPAYYEFLDDSPLLNGNNYYRIRQIDYDGGENLSSTLILNVKDIASRKIDITPMPLTSSSLYVMELYWPRDEAVAQFRIVDMSGRVVDRFEEHLQEGYNNFMNLLGDFNPGIYLMVVYGADGDYMAEKFMISN